MSDLEPINLVAVVRFNKGEAYVFNRLPVLKYRYEGRDLIATDGPFGACYRYEAPQGRFKAFAGREFHIPMEDGTFTAASGQFWHASLPEYRSIAASTVDDLLRCYVYSSIDVQPEALQGLRDTYEGCVYPYYDYEAVINYAPQRMKLCRKIRKLESDKAALIKHVKAAHRTIEQIGAAA